MSTSEQDQATPDQLSIRVERFQRKLDSILKTDNLSELLYLDRKLSRSEFDASVIEIGYRAALRKLASEALAGDVKALDLFLKRCDLYFSTKRVSEAPEEATAAPYSRPQRNTPETQE